ncbi:hypothetical protein WN55_03942 [Dufourea novaeangliae]|uniref:Uncharacterized protein n=1 Tax=Dufourea novaeangliae TaxID=178035 RepID=A0A154PKM7_DUFNO|nr:hypothetical protein WN55_03942 [Dufourea novaeangliae]
MKASYPAFMRTASLLFTLFMLQMVTEGNGTSFKDTDSGLSEMMIGVETHFRYRNHM